jgi:hypothetical protein
MMTHVPNHLRASPLNASRLPAHVIYNQRSRLTHDSTTMTPRTRAANKDANFKAYYSKKVPQQIHFPHKRKTVRRRSTPVQDGSGKRQMVFLPEKMKVRRTETVGDSDAEDEDIYLEEEDVEEGGVAITAQPAGSEDEQRTARKTNKEGKKRDSDVMHAEDGEDDEPARPTPKRRRRTASPKPNRRSRRVDAESNDEQTIDRTRTLRRQSTMTQLVDGRKPLPGFEEPDFKPVKRSPRLSWGKGKGGKAAKDRKQRTLTQMVPRPVEIMSDEDIEDTLSDVEAEERDSQVYGDAVAKRLAQQEFQAADRNGDQDMTRTQEVSEGVQPVVHQEHEGNEPQVHSQDVPEVVVQSVEDDTDIDNEDNYQPTQFIDAPTTRAGRTPRRKTTAQATSTHASKHVSERPVRASKSRFSLLATPEKKRVCEIPSSQSPADSLLSTQVTPLKAHRSPLKERSGNPANAPETPSKRKQVTFEVPAKTPVPPPTLRKFESTIQDSEDEDDDIIEEDVPLSGRRIGAYAQVEINKTDNTAPSNAVGVDTQAMLDQIDQACANADEDSEMTGEQSSQDSTALPVLQSQHEPSPELGELHKQSSGFRGQNDPAGHLDQTSHNTTAEDQAHENDEDEDEDEDATMLPVARLSEERPVISDASTNTESELPEPAEQLRSTPPIIEPYVQDTFPSTPMVIQDDSSDEEDAPDPDLTPPSSSRRTLPNPPSTDIEQSADLDGEPVQVPRSPSPQHETQQSHSSKAEQQIQSEWLSYTQYANTRPPQSSSMRAAPDAFSYNATPHAPPPRSQLHPPQNSHLGIHPSQATTVDDTTQRTPRRNRTLHFSSPHTTPHRIASSQPVISPSKPPPLFIPSSFPSPEKAAMEGWSSPIMGQTQMGAYRSSQWASLEDFSIPPPPPMEWED